MKFQNLFSGKKKKKRENISKCCLLKILPRVLSRHFFEAPDMVLFFFFQPKSTGPSDVNQHIVKTLIIKYDIYANFFC